jgi:DNA-directed RNA polymerase subunit RPC12/RpoP
MHDVTVVCQGCGKEFMYRTTLISTVGVAVCPHCGVRDRTASPRGKPESPLDGEAPDHSELTDPNGSRKRGLT